MVKIEFGAKMIRQARTAFDRQLAESVEIQNNTKHNILNSKSEYDRCALPRLTSKLGEISMDEIEKEKREEKDRERKLLAQIREIKVQRSMNRREIPRNRKQPVKKRRKIGEEKHIRVEQEEKKSEKRKDEEVGEAGLFPIFKRKKIIADDEIEREEERPLWDDYEERKTDEELKLEWEERLRLREESIQKEEEERKRLITKAEKLRKSWELLRVCREMIETEGDKWQKSKERRLEEKMKYEERERRLQVAGEKKRQTLDKLEKRKIQNKITENLRQLPENRRILIEREEEKERRLLLQEAKIELWKKWRKKKNTDIIIFPNFT